MKISQKEQKLLIALACVILVAGALQFGFFKYSNKKSAIEEDIKTLQEQYDGLLIKEQNRSKYQEYIKTSTEEIQQLAKSYPSAITDEKEIMFALAIEDYAKVKFSNIAFGESATFYTPGQTTEETASSVDELAVLNSVVGVVEKMTVSFKGSYDQMKRMIEYITTYQYRKTVDSLSVSYDKSSGQLSGTMVVNNYYIPGDLCSYEPPVINYDKLGVDSIFGRTVEK